jgi:hypothetical protein
LLHDELAELEQKLLSNLRIGISLGGNIFKVRLATKDKGKGKSGEFRIIKTELLKIIKKIFS